jgi:hypothetical protein
MEHILRFRLLLTGVFFSFYPILQYFVPCDITQTIDTSTIFEKTTDGNALYQSGSNTVVLSDENEFDNDDNDDQNTKTNTNNKINHPSCPLAVQNNYGLFDTQKSSSSVKHDFQDTVLLVACNHAYLDMLQNWEFLASQLNLKWAVLAMDEDLYDVLGPTKAISPGHEFSVSGPQNFRKGGFNKLSCNKMRMVMDVAENCGVNIVFSDVDNIFYKNPFEHDLGRLIKSNHFDYIYQSNHEAPRKPLKDKCLQGIPRSEANTGFYYLKKNSSVLKKVVNTTLDRCEDPKNKIDDQSLFWEEFWKYNETHTTEKFHHCNVMEYVDPSNKHGSTDASSFNFCCLDPYYYPVGRPSIPKNKDPVSYHANYVSGHLNKVNKIRNSRADNFGWNDTRITPQMQE